MYAEKHEIQLMLREVREADAKGKSIVIAATNDRNVNLFIAEQARQAGALVNVADSPEDSDFFVPATINRGHLTIAITTNGKIPALSRRIKENLEKQFGNEYESYLQLLEPAREAIYTSSTHSAGRKVGLIEELLDLPLLPLLKEKKHGAAQQTVQDFLRKHGV
jgi:precorrin-2 dehydrogenase/sirohydrochlorin ferrochelatase